MLKILTQGVLLTPLLSCNFEQTPPTKVSAETTKSAETSTGEKRFALAIGTLASFLNQLAASSQPESLPLSCSKGVRRWPQARRPDKSEFIGGKVTETVLQNYPGIADCIPFSAGMYDSYCSHAEDGRLVCFCESDGNQAKSAIYVNRNSI